MQGAMVFNKVNVLFMHGSEARFSTFLFKTIQVTQSVLVSFLTKTKSSEDEPAFSNTYDVKQV